MMHRAFAACAHHRRAILPIVLCSCVGAFLGFLNLLPYPSTPKKPVVDEYYGIKVTDDYRWLENPNDPEVARWIDSQNQYTRACIDKIPARSAILEQLKSLNSGSSASYFGVRNVKDVLFAEKYQPPKNQPFLVALKSPDDTATERVVLDPNVINKGGTTAVDFYVPSLDGKYVAVSLSEGGSEDGTLHIYETATGKELSDVVPRVNYPTAGGNVAWNADGSGFYYTRYPHEGERPKEDVNFYQQVYFHKLGTRTGEDTYVIGKEFPRIAEVTLKTSNDGRYLLVTVANGDGGEFAHYLLTPGGKWIQITRFSDKITEASFSPDGDDLFLLSINGAPMGKILRLPTSNPNLANVQMSVPESHVAIRGFVVTDKLLYVTDMAGGPMQLRMFSYDGKMEGMVPIKPVSSVYQVVEMKNGRILFYNVSYLDPPAWYRYDPATKRTEQTAWAETSPASFDDAKVSREFATSKDGTKIPMNIIHKKGIELNGSNPTLLTGYGGYSVSLSPGFDPTTRVWLDHGGVYVIANLRGGAEYGEAWHSAGKLTRKQNVFDDFAACAQFLLDRKYTSPEKLAIEGGSNGGLLMGAELTQHPDLFRAVVSHVGIYDMLRWELEPNGAFNVTEFGSVKDPDQFKALFAYSPYHHVKAGSAYPAVFMLTGEHDGRVDPRNSRKMTAILQAASTSGRPIILWTSKTAGHGIGTSVSEEIAQQADVFAFLFDQLVIPDREVR